MIKVLCGFVIAAFSIPLLIAAGSESLHRPHVSTAYNMSPMTWFIVALLCLFIGIGLIFL